MRRLVFAALAVAVAVGVGAVLATDEGPPPSSPLPGGSVGETVLGLCAAADAASAGTVEGARDAFYDRSHEGLHALARLAGDADRAATARLLEAKRDVEAALEDARASEALAAGLRELLDRTRAAAIAVDADPPPCPDGGG